MARAIDLTGFRTKNAVVVGPSGSNQAGKLLWLCRCDCGNEFVGVGTKLRYGSTSHCGCMKGKNVSAGKLRHGMTRTPEFRSWESAKARCLNKRDKDYPNYGGRGIMFCDRWLDFENFLVDMGARPPGTTIDRIDTNGHYEPGNCRWATDKEQQSNRRNNIRVPVDGQVVTLFDYCGGTRSPFYQRVAYRVKRGWSLADAMFQPAMAV